MQKIISMVLILSYCCAYSMEQNMESQIKTDEEIAMEKQIKQYKNVLIASWEILSTMSPSDTNYDIIQQQIELFKKQLPAGYGDAIIKDLENQKKQSTPKKKIKLLSFLKKTY